MKNEKTKLSRAAKIGPVIILIAAALLVANLIAFDATAPDKMTPLAKLMDSASGMLFSIGLGFMLGVLIIRSEKVLDRFEQVVDLVRRSDGVKRIEKEVEEAEATEKEAREGKGA